MAAAWDLSGIEKGLQEAVDRMREGAADGLEQVAQDALARMQRACPVESGALRASGTAVVDRETLQAAVGFGSGPSAEYAVIQHENLSLSHGGGGQAKFAEQPFVAQVVPSAGQKFADSVKAKL